VFLFRQIAPANGVTHSLQVHFKAGTHDYVFISMSRSNDAYYGAAFNLASESVINTGSAGTISATSNSITALGNGWYRCEITANITGTEDSPRIRIGLSDASPTWALGSPSFIHSGGETVYVWGAQFEAGSFPTSYIPNNGAPSGATRSADIASIPVTDFGYNQKSGTVVVEWNSPDDTMHIANFNTDASNRWVILKDTGNQKSFISDGGSAVMNSVIAAAPSGDNKSGMSISSSSANGVINGGSVVSDTSVSVPSVTTLSIGKDESSNYWLNGHIKSIQYYPRRLTNTQLQELTS
jgi:hypothetical protein